MNLVAASRIETVSVPGWAELAWLAHGFSTRPGGRTTVYQAARAEREPGRAWDGDLNLGFTANDHRETVCANREMLVSHLLGPKRPASAGLVTLRQTHSGVTHRVDRSHARACGSAAVIEGDGLMTDTPGVLLGILTADCVPVLVVDPVRRAVAAFHAGWRGTVQQIVELGIGQMQREFGSVPEELLAAIGPAIGACCYTVGEEVRKQFAARFAYADELLAEADRALTAADMGAKSGEPAGPLRLDLAEANRRQLLSAGLSATNVVRTKACTSCETARFFSHRAEQGATGRMMAVIGVRGA